MSKLCCWNFSEKKLVKIPFTLFPKQLNLTEQNLCGIGCLFYILFSCICLFPCLCLHPDRNAGMCRNDDFCLEWSKECELWHFLRKLRIFSKLQFFARPDNSGEPVWVEGSEAVTMTIIMSNNNNKFP